MKVSGLGSSVAFLMSASSSLSYWPTISLLLPLVQRSSHSLIQGSTKSALVHRRKLREPTDGFVSIPTSHSHQETEQQNFVSTITASTEGFLNKKSGRMETNFLGRITGRGWDQFSSAFDWFGRTR